MKRIYLAGPYTHENPEVMQSRYEVLNMVAARLMREGNNVFSPISHSHPIAGYLPDDYRRNFDFWMGQDLSFINLWADELHVLCNEGWETSRGVLREIEWANIHKIPIEHILL